MLTRIMSMWCVYESWMLIFEPRNVLYEHHVFHQLTPTKGGTADKFMVRLHKQARHCNFGTALEENLRDQLIEKLPDVDITLEAAMDKV